MAVVDRRGVSVDATDTAIAGDPNPGLAIKAPCLVATTGNIVLSGLKTIDGVALVAGNRVLVWKQTDLKLNGLYNASTGPWTRTVDCSSNDEIVAGMRVSVTSGFQYAGVEFGVLSPDPVRFGVSDILFGSILGIGIDGVSFNTVAGLQLAKIPPDIETVSLRGYWTAGDGAAHLRRRDATGDVTSADGAKWKVASQPINIRMFGAKPDRVTSASDAIDAAIAHIRNGAAGNAYLLGGSYKITRAIALDNSADAGRFTKRVSLIGETSGSTEIYAPGIAGPAVHMIGNPASVESYETLRGFRIEGDNTASSIGLQIQICAFAGVSDVVIEGFEQGIDANDMEQARFELCEVRFNVHGVKTRIAAFTTDPNSIWFEDCTIGNNYLTNGDFEHSNAIYFHGGSNQYAGVVSADPSVCWGFKFHASGTGYATIGFGGGFICEGNCGSGDLWFDQDTNPVAIDIDGVGFTRTFIAGVTGFGVNQIKVTGTSPSVRLDLRSNEHRSFAPYAANVARPYIAISNVNVMVTDIGSHYQDAIEAPAWAPANALGNQIVVGGNGRGAPIGVARFQANTNQNVIITTNFTLGTGASIASVDDANLVLLPLEYRASQHLFTGPVSISGNFAINTNKFNVTASNGNTAIAGTLAVASNALFGAASSTISAGFISHIGTNKNVITGGNFVLGDGSSISSVDDASALKGLELRATSFALTNGPVSVTDATASTSTATGALKVSGGLGVVGQASAANFAAFSSPATVANFDTSGSTTVPVTNGSSGAIAPAGQGFGHLIVVDTTNGAQSEYSLNGGATVMVTPTNTFWDNPGAGPAAGKSSITFSGGAYKAFNNTGATVNYRVTNTKSN